jgi:hypothetical protein
MMAGLYGHSQLGFSSLQGIIMEVKVLNRKIDALAKANLKVEGEIQALGLACLNHVEVHGDVTPLNRLYNALRKTQFQAFAEWALSFGKVSKNQDKKTKEQLPLAFDKSKKTDMVAAIEKPWFEFADDKAKATAKAFDFQQAMMALIKKGAAAGYDHDTLVKAAAVAGIKPEKVPASVTTGEEAAKAVGEALV